MSFPKSGFMRLPVHVDDVAEAFVRVTMSDSCAHPVYNTGGIPISMGDLADIVRGFLPDADISFGADGGIGGLRQLPGRQQPSSGRVRAGIPVAGDVGAQHHQRRAPRQWPASGLVGRKGAKTQSIYVFPSA